MGRPDTRKLFRLERKQAVSVTENRIDSYHSLSSNHQTTSVADYFSLSSAYRAASMALMTSSFVTLRSP